MQHERPYWYTLINKIAVPCTHFDAEAVLRSRVRRRVGSDMVGDLHVSTVFLSLDHNHSGKGPPILFETMILGDTDHSYQTRCSTWKEAEAMHAVALEVAQGWQKESIVQAARALKKAINRVKR